MVRHTIYIGNSDNILPVYFNLKSNQFLMQYNPIIHYLHCVTFTLLPSCPDYTERVWVGGRQPIIDPDTDTDLWVWDHSAIPIDRELWRPGKPDFTPEEDHVFIDIDYALDDGRGSWALYFLCETAISNLLC